MTTLAYRRQRTDILQVYRIIHQHDKIPFEQFFSYNTSSARGHNFKLEKNYARTDLRAKSFSNRVISKWNSLPDDVVDCTTINSFKGALERAWKDDLIKYKFPLDEQ